MLIHLILRNRCNSHDKAKIGIFQYLCRFAQYPSLTNVRRNMNLSGMQSAVRYVLITSILILATGCGGEESKLQTMAQPKPPLPTDTIIEDQVSEPEVKAGEEPSMGATEPVTRVTTPTRVTAPIMGMGLGGGFEEEAPRVAAKARAPRPADSQLAEGRTMSKRVTPTRGIASERPVAVVTKERLGNMADDVLARMGKANIAFNAPEKIEIGMNSQVQLLMSVEDEIAELEAQITEPGVVVSARVSVSQTMRATLKGTGFTITAVTDEEQIIPTTERSEWLWNVKPTSGGTQVLQLTLTAVLDVDGKQAKRTIKTFQKEIEVEVPYSFLLSEFVSNNWQWLWSALLVPVGGWIVIRIRTSKRSAKAS